MTGSQYASRLRVMILSISGGTLLMAVKFTAYFLTGSTAILSDALESIINVAASGFALFSVYLGHQPADSRHPYGHGKIEYFSVGFEGALILLAAVAILFKAIPLFFRPQPLARLDLGIVLLLGSAAVNLGLGLFLIHIGRKTRSLAIEADGKHLLTDVWTSGAVVVGLVLVRITRWSGWDPVVACMVAVNIIFTGWRLLGQSFGRLMDEADQELLGRIVAILNQHRRPEWVDIHQLRARHYGPEAYVELHLIVPRSYGVLEAHRQAKEIERILLDSHEEIAEVTVHLDPCEDPFCEQCLQHRCQDRAAGAPSSQSPWRLEEVVGKRRHRLR